MSGFLIALTVILIIIIVIQISKVSEYVGILRGKEEQQLHSNKVNAWLMLGTLIFGFIGIYLSHEHWKGLLLPEAASVQGQRIDHLIFVTLIITGIVFVATHLMLFLFAFFFRARVGHKAHSFPRHFKTNDRLEITWTTATLLCLMIIIIFGLREWTRITGPAPKDADIVEVTGKQFNWMFRYPGADGELGRKNFQLIDPSNENPLGQDFQGDKANRDDVVSNGVMHLVVNKPVKLLINSQDVIHSVGLPHFRLKLDAVPGVPTTLWFTPTITTKEMIEKTKDPDFVYELACDQLCGNGHYSMRATIIVETQEEFDAWEKGEKPQYDYAMESMSRDQKEKIANNEDQPTETDGKIVKR